MNQVTHEQKDSVTKSFAIIGFLAAILFAVWLAVQIVSVIPSAFNSLASIADGIYNYDEDETLIVATKSTIINTGEAFTITWTELAQPGTYTFSYQCEEGVSASIRNTQGEIIALDCDRVLTLDDQTTLDVVITSEKKRFTDVLYTVQYTPKNEKKVPVTTNSQVTIVNARIPTHVADETEETQTVTQEQQTTEEEEVTTPTTNLTPGAPTVIEVPIYAIPVSDPNGKIDLKVTYLGVGTLTGKTFSKSGTIATDEKGAFKFSVQNIGTKTADTWSYTATLPSGIEYDAGSQKALKPNEKAVITIGFEGLTQVGIEKFGATVTAKNDVNKKNNSFTWAVKVVE